MPNCSRIVKSQGLCQRHGAKARKCKIDDCEKQAQGNFDGMCKYHFKKTKTQLIAKPVTAEDLSPEPVGQSVYDAILPESIGWSDENEPMPLIKHLKDGFDSQKPRGWHRNEERRSRGLPPVPNPAVQLEGWERELVWLEICLLSGCPKSSFRHLARSWGRDKGFHMVLAQFICERRGNVERKKRIKGESLTRKSRRVPLELAPNGEELPNVMELDDVELDIFGCDLSSSQEIEDPTVNFTHIPNFSNLVKRERQHSVEMSPSTEQLPQENLAKKFHSQLSQRLSQENRVQEFHSHLSQQPPQENRMQAFHSLMPQQLPLENRTQEFHSMLSQQAPQGHCSPEFHSYLQGQQQQQLINPHIEHPLYSVSNFNGYMNSPHQNQVLSPIISQPVISPGDLAIGEGNLPSRRTASQSSHYLPA